MRLRLLLSFLLLLLVPRPASAQTQRYFLTGHVTSAVIPNNVLAPHTNVGDTVSGFFDFNPNFGSIQGGVTLNIDGDVWSNSQYSVTGLPSTGTTNITGNAAFGTGPGGVTDSIIGLNLVNNVGTFHILSTSFSLPGTPTADIRGDLQMYTTPEPGGLALAVPCLLPGVWWLRRRRLPLQHPS